MVSCEGEQGFRSVQTSFTMRGEGIRISAEAMEAIGATRGSAIGVTAMPKKKSGKSAKSGKSGKSGKSKKS